MTPRFQILDARQTPLGLLSLRRRHDTRLGAEVFEIKLGEEFLMSSHYTASEVALADLALAELEAPDPPGEKPPGETLDLVIGGLGLGYTAQAALAHPSVGTLLVVEALDAVIDWHEGGLLPLGKGLSDDPRCRFVAGDFFTLADSHAGFDPQTPARRFDAVLLDIDHAPDRHLAPAHAAFYLPADLDALTRHLKPGGLFALWSDDPPDETFTATLTAVFAEARAEPVAFHSPLQDREVVQTVYLARKAAE